MIIHMMLRLLNQIVSDHVFKTTVCVLTLLPQKRHYILYRCISIDIMSQFLSGKNVKTEFDVTIVVID